MSALWDDIKDSLKVLALYVFALGLVSFGCYGLYVEKNPKATDPHAIIVAVGLLLLPFFPRVFAGAVKQVGSAIADAWKARNS